MGERQLMGSGRRAAQDSTNQPWTSCPLRGRRGAAESSPFLQVHVSRAIMSAGTLNRAGALVPFPLTMSNSSLWVPVDFLSRKCWAMSAKIMGRCHSSRTRRSKAVVLLFASAPPCWSLSLSAAVGWTSVRNERSSLAGMQVALAQHRDGESSGKTFEASFTPFAAAQDEAKDAVRHDDEFVIRDETAAAAAAQLLQGPRDDGD